MKKEQIRKRRLKHFLVLAITALTLLSVELNWVMINVLLALSKQIKIKLSKKIKIN